MTSEGTKAAPEHKYSVFFCWGTVTGKDGSARRCNRAYRTWLGCPQEHDHIKEEKGREHGKDT